MQQLEETQFYCATIAYHVGLNAYSDGREASRPTSKKKRHLLLAIASGCHHVICPLCYLLFSCWSPPFWNRWEVFTAVFYLYLSAVCLLFFPFYAFHLLICKAHSGQFSALSVV